MCDQRPGYACGQPGLWSSVSVIPVCIHLFVDNVGLFLLLLCKDGNFFRRGKSWEVESICRATSHAMTFVGAASYAARKKRHEMAPLQKRGKRVSPDSVNE